MNELEIKRMNAYTDKHVRDPQIGDHFTEFLGSVALIVDRKGDALIIQRTTIIGGKRGWADPEPMTIADFIKWASYGGNTHGYWLELYPPQWPEELLAGG